MPPPANPRNVRSHVPDVQGHERRRPCRPLSPAGAGKAVSLLSGLPRFSGVGWRGGALAGPGTGRHGECSPWTRQDGPVPGGTSRCIPSSFGLKRAHHGVLRVTRRALAQLGLTAARFDMMYAIQEREGLRQIALCRALGVSGATVSRMLASLEKLGLVTRDTTCTDMRQRFVYLTDAGRRCIRKAIRRFMRWGTRRSCSSTARSVRTSGATPRRALARGRPWKRLADLVADRVRRRREPLRTLG